MTAPMPIIGVRGRAPKELVGAASGGVGTRPTVQRPQPESITFPVCGAGEEIHYPAHPAAWRVVPPWLFGVKVDLTAFHAARLMAPVHVAGAAGSRYVVRWSDSRAIWCALGAADVEVSLATVDPLAVGATVPLRTTATGDVYLALFIVDGDGVATPATGPVTLQLLPEGTRVDVPAGERVEYVFEGKSAAQLDTDWPISSTTTVVPGWQPALSPDDGSVAATFNLSTDLDPETDHNAVFEWFHTLSGLTPGTEYVLRAAMQVTGFVDTATPHGVLLNGGDFPGSPNVVNRPAIVLVANSSGEVEVGGYLDCTEAGAAFIRNVYFDSVVAIAANGCIVTPEAATVKRVFTADVEFTGTGAGGGFKGLNFPFGDGSTAEIAGAVRRLPIPYGYTVVGWNITADAACSAQFQVQARGFGESLVNLVGAGTAPALAGAIEARDTDGTLDWASTTVAADGEAVVTLIAYTPGTSKYVGLTLKIEPT